MSAQGLEPIQHDQRVHEPISNHTTTASRRRRQLSLSIRVSLGLVIAAILPLLIMVVFSEIQSRPALITQANTAMASDAKTRVQLIDTYFNERQLDTETIAQVTSVQQFLAAPLDPKSPAYQDLALHASYGLVAGIFRDKNYTTWQLFAPNGQIRLYYPQKTPPKPHGKNLVPPDYLIKVRELKNANAFISPVYYSPETQKASVDIYSPIYMQSAPGATTQSPTYLGFVRGTLNLDYIWNIVDTDQGSNGKGSYAFILDENGIRIADTDPGRRFKAVASIPDDAQQLIWRDARFGSTTDAVEVLADNELAQQIKNSASQTGFQDQPAGQNENFQVIQHATSVISWKYIVLSPVSTITAIADQQQQAIILVAAAMALLTALIGLIVGRNITRPILTSVNYLRDNSQSLSTLATRQRDAASEQIWVVDSSQVGLQSIQYYTEAINIAARELTELGTSLTQNWNYTDAWKLQQALERIVSASRYIENASQYQHSSNEKLATALKVATQVTEQLAAGATSATAAAAQLEEVVTRLRLVVGK
jgi:hypothetical protein